MIAIGVEPDGLNINAGCGSTNLGALRAAVLDHRANAGIAYDGDADRCLAVDENGDVLDGDQILAILALALNESGRTGRATRWWRPSWRTWAFAGPWPRLASTSWKPRSETGT